MRTVRGPEGDRLLLLDASDGVGVVRDPTSGERQRVPVDDLDPVDAPPLPRGTDALDDGGPLADLAAPGRDQRPLGLLIELDARGPTAVATLLSATDLCESDLHGTVAELTVAGLLDETTVAGRRGYRLTERARRALERGRNEE